MNANQKSTESVDMKVTLQALWIFVMFNYLYCDLLSNMDSGVLKELLTGHVGSLQIDHGFMLGAAILMEIPIAMVLLSRILKYRTNRWVNIISGVIMTLAQLSTLLFGTRPTPHYLFYSIIEIACTAFIAWNAWKWIQPIEPAIGS